MKKRLSTLLILLVVLTFIFALSGCTKDKSKAEEFTKEKAIQKITSKAWNCQFYQNTSKPFSEKRRMKFILDDSKKIIIKQRYSSKTEELIDESDYDYTKITWDAQSKILSFVDADSPGTGFRFVFLENNEVKFTNLSIVGYHILS